MINFFIRDGYVESCKIIKFKNLKFLLNKDITISAEFSTIFSQGKNKWVSFLFEHTRLSSIIFKQDNIVLLKEVGADWNKTLAIFSYKLMGAIEGDDHHYSIKKENILTSEDGCKLINLEDLESILQKKPVCIKSMLFRDLLYTEIKKSLTEALDEHGGKVEVLHVNTLDKFVTFEFQGSCSLCQSNKMINYLNNIVKNIDPDYTALFV